MSQPRQNPKILFLQHDSIFENYGGVQYYIDDFLNFFSAIYGPQSLHVLLAHRKPNLNIEARPYSIETHRLPQGLLRKVHNRFNTSYFFKALKLCQQLKPSLIISSHIHFAPIAALISKITQTPFMVIAYGVDVWGHYTPRDTLALKQADRLMSINYWKNTIDVWGHYTPHDTWALKQADGIISISYWTKTFLEKRGFSPEKITVIHPSLNPELLKTASNFNPETSSRLETSSLSLLTISRLSSGEKYKGHDHVLEALKLIREMNPELKINYTIQGSGDDLARLQQKTQSLNLSDFVTFLSAFPSRDELKRIYTQYDVFIMPSRFGFWGNHWRGEGFGIVYVEAGLFGLPCIAYRCGGVTDIIEDQKNGLLVEPDNIPELAKAIIKLATDKELVRRLGSEARKMAMERFTPEHIQIEMRAVFEHYANLKFSPLTDPTKPNNP